jgi:hypothetical protein
MKTLRWLPLAYLAGLQGFVMFGAYVVLVLGTRQVLHSCRRFIS